MQIIKNLVDESKYSIKCPYEMKPEGITVHNTANDAPAKNEVSYMISNNDKVSFHYAVDDKEIVQGIPENRNAWHAGDGGEGKGNRKTIGIEICYSYCDKQVNGKWVADEDKWKSQYKSKFEKAQENAAEFVASKLKEYGWGIDKVYTHKNWSGKHCPHRTLDNYGWDRFLGMIRDKLNPKVEVISTVSIELTVLQNGTRCEEVKTLQTLLNAKGYKGKNGKVLSVDGIFGSNTDYAVRAFQTAEKLSVDGIVGKNTWNKLLKG